MADDGHEGEAEQEYEEEEEEVSELGKQEHWEVKEWDALFSPHTLR